MAVSQFTHDWFDYYESHFSNISLVSIIGTSVGLMAWMGVPALKPLGYLVFWGGILNLAFGILCFTVTIRMRIEDARISALDDSSKGHTLAQQLYLIYGALCLIVACPAIALFFLVR